MGGLGDAQNDHFEAWVVGEQTNETQHAHHLETVNEKADHVEVGDEVGDEPAGRHDVNDVVELAQVFAFIGREEEPYGEIDEEPGEGAVVEADEPRGDGAFDEAKCGHVGSVGAGQRWVIE